jgi:quinol-cytochrome oxidoreductase complex cytochrome b subunit
VTPRSARLHPLTLVLAGLAFGVYPVVAQARDEATLAFLVACIALLAVAQWLSRQGTSTPAADLWEWVAATLTFVLVLGGWQLLAATDPTGPDGAPWALRIVVVAATAVPLTGAAWLVLRGSHR